MKTVFSQYRCNFLFLKSVFSHNTSISFCLITLVILNKHFLNSKNQVLILTVRYE